MYEKLDKLRAEVERFMRRTHPDIICVITIDHSFAAIPPEKAPD